jgi:hypothetical protein
MAHGHSEFLFDFLLEPGTALTANAALLRALLIAPRALLLIAACALLLIARCALLLIAPTRPRNRGRRREYSGTRPKRHRKRARDRAATRYHDRAHRLWAAPSSSPSLTHLLFRSRLRPTAR